MIATLPSAAPVLNASCGIEDAAVRRIKSCLRDRAHRPGGGEEIWKLHRAAGAKLGPVLQPHPGLRDDAENALRADHQAVRARARRPSRGAGGVSITPFGVTTRSDSTRSSMWV